MRRNGGRLRVEAPHGAWLVASPRIRAVPLGSGEGVFELVIGRGVRIEPGLALEIWARGTNRLAIGDETALGDGVRIELRSGSIELGDRVDVRTLAMLKSYGRLTVGDQVVLSRGVYVQCEQEIAIAEQAAFGEWVSVIDSDHTPDGSDVHVLAQPLRVEPIEVGSNVLVARGAAVLRGAKLGKNSLVAANSVVLRGEYPPAHLLAGSPAKAVRRLDDEA
jgi:acetyltransferase-like isoleucine patch superfamily enzyme